MRIGRRKARTFVVAGLAVSVVMLATGSAFAGFFDDLFGSRRQDSPAALPYASTATLAPAPAVTQSPQPSVPSFGSGSVTY
jgi:hypothetical protein